jgi:hypothetical protein
LSTTRHPLAANVPPWVMPLILERETKLKPIDKHNHKLAYPDGFEKAKGVSHQAVASGAEGEMFLSQLLHRPLADHMGARI